MQRFAFVYRQPGVVRALYRVPVDASRRRFPGRQAEPTGVVGDSRRADLKCTCNSSLAEALREQSCNVLSGLAHGRLASDGMRNNVATTDRAVPGADGESETKAALAQAVAFVVVGLDCFPVETRPSPTIDREAEPSRTRSHRRRGYAEPSRDLCTGKARLEQRSELIL